jgi:dihydropteroate synthase
LSDRRTVNRHHVRKDVDHIMNPARPLHTFVARGKTLALGRRTVLMGVVNVTPDSFSDGGSFLSPESAVARALELLEAGADVIDIGGESTRPGADPVPVDVELGRVLPVLRMLRPMASALLSVDTTKAAVAEQALDAGADLVNDVSALGDPETGRVVARAGAGLVLMHRQGTPKTMQVAPKYEHLLEEVRDFLSDRVARAESAGVAPRSILIDPGFGFGKTAAHNLRLLNRLGFLAELGKPILAGVSRKTFIGRVLNLPVEHRLFGSAAAVTAAILRGAHVVRVHDLPEMSQVARVADALIAESEVLEQAVAGTPRETRP